MYYIIYERVNYIRFHAKNEDKKMKKKYTKSKIIKNVSLYFISYSSIKNIYNNKKLTVLLLFNEKRKYNKIFFKVKKKNSKLLFKLAKYC